MDEEREIEERAADATEESRRRRGAEGETIEDEPEAGRLQGEPNDDEPDMRT
jgi:hypothetical protein